MSILNLEAEILLAHVLGVSREKIIAHPEMKIPGRSSRHFKILCAKREKGMPLAYITHHKEFFGLNFYIDERVLIPRPETEILVEETLKLCLEGGNYNSVLDIGTGSGCIAVTLAKKMLNARIIAVDISVSAINVAKKNAQMHNVADKIEFIKSDLLSGVLDRNIDIIVANLPYIGEAEKRFVSRETLDYEPRAALFAGKTGLELFEKLFRQLGEVVLRPKYLLAEVGFSQKPAIGKLIKSYFGNVDVKWRKDLAGINRVFIIKF